MANWCWNELHADEEIIKDIAEKYIVDDELGEPEFDFNKIDPINSSEESEESKNLRWLSIWGSDSIGHKVNISKRYIRFETEMNPPMGILKMLATLYADHTLILRYFEPAMGFRGKATAYYDSYLNKLKFKDNLVSFVLS